MKNNLPLALIPLLMLPAIFATEHRSASAAVLSPAERAEIVRKLEVEELAKKLDVQRQLQEYVDSHHCKKVGFMPPSKFESQGELLDAPSEDQYMCPDNDFEFVRHWNEQDRLWHNRPR